jgi:hypothetical protein
MLGMSLVILGWILRKRAKAEEEPVKEEEEGGLTQAVA